MLQETVWALSNIQRALHHVSIIISYRKYPNLVRIKK